MATSLRTRLLCGQVYDTATGGKGKSKVDIAKDLLTPSFLDIIREDDIESPEVRKAFDHAVHICRMRLIRLMDKVKNKRMFHNNPEKRNDVFLDLTDREFSGLICDPAEGSQQFSQSSTCSS